MNAPAVPDYVTKAAGNFDGCPPGHRFNLYFPIWKSDWQLDKTGKANALRQTLKLGSAAAVLTDLRRRQKALAEALGQGRYFILEARSIAPFATGLGLEHPIENGFAFLSPYGLPYLAGSGVKGVLRRAGEELEQEGELPPGTIDALFGPENIREPEDARRGALSCWDVFPVPDKGEMVVEIMTPHFSHYYQPEKGKEQFATPHDAGKPTPIPFLAVPANSEFRFIVTFEAELMPTALPGNAWQEQIQKIITRAFDWLGFGAKTAVGYGAMEENKAQKAERERVQAEDQAAKERQQEAQRRAALPADERFLTELDEKLNALAKDPRTGKTRILPSSDSTWPGMLHLVDTHLEALGSLTKIAREELASQVKKRLASAYKVEGKAEKALKEKLTRVRG